MLVIVFIVSSLSQMGSSCVKSGAQRRGVFLPPTPTRDLYPLFIQNEILSARRCMYANFISTPAYNSRYYRPPKTRRIPRRPSTPRTVRIVGGSGIIHAEIGGVVDVHIGAVIASPEPLWLASLTAPIKGHGAVVVSILAEIFGRGFAKGDPRLVRGGYEHPEGVVGKLPEQLSLHALVESGGQPGGLGGVGPGVGDMDVVSREGSVLNDG